MVTPSISQILCFLWSASAKVLSHHDEKALTRSPMSKPRLQCFNSSINKDQTLTANVMK